MDIFKEFQENMELLTIKVLFDKMVKKMENDMKERAKSYGIELDCEFKCKVESVNLDTLHENIDKAKESMEVK